MTGHPLQHEQCRLRLPDRLRLWEERGSRCNMECNSGTMSTFGPSLHNRYRRVGTFTCCCWGRFDSSGANGSTFICNRIPVGNTWHCKRTYRDDHTLSWDQSRHLGLPWHNTFHYQRCAESCTHSFLIHYYCYQSYLLDWPLRLLPCSIIPAARRALCYH